MTMAKAKQAAVGDNSNDLSGHNRRALFFINRADWLAAMAKKKEADAAVKKIGKTIKAELGEYGLDQIKEYDLAQTPEGQAKLKAKVEATMESMAWAGMPVGTQLDLLTDRAPAIERAARDGEEAGMRGDTLANPFNESSPEGQAYAEAWRRGQEAIFAIRKMRAEPPADELIKVGGDDPFEDEPQRVAAE